MRAKILLALSIGALSGCGPEKTDGAPAAAEHVAVTEARATFPRFLDLQTQVLSSTCSPNPGVCHNSSNYPNLESAGNTLTFIDEPCNTEMPNPLDGWDSCEKSGHVLAADILGVTFQSVIAWVEQAAEGSWDVRMSDPSPATRRVLVWFENPDGSNFYLPPLAVTTNGNNFSVTVELTQDSPDAVVEVNTSNGIERAFADSVIATVLGGDPNHNGILGAQTTESAAVFYPGDLARSYLWGRITGTVPGSRMPLANAPITFPAYVAIACWIEGLDDNSTPPEAEDVIDYDACTFADAPIDYTLQ